MGLERSFTVSLAVGLDFEDTGRGDALEDAAVLGLHRLRELLGEAGDLVVMVTDETGESRSLGVRWDGRA